MDLSNLKPNEGAVSERSRVGRGHASGNGKTAARGHKGHKARSGGSTTLGIQGGQMHL